jgi:hypothetical protein
MAYNPAAYEARRRAYTNEYASTGAMNAYTQFLSQQRGQRDLTNMYKQYDKAAPQVVAGYGRRGLNSANVKSGTLGKVCKILLLTVFPTRLRHNRGWLNRMLVMICLTDSWAIGIRVVWLIWSQRRHNKFNRTLRN